MQPYAPPKLEQARERYAGLTHRPLRVTAWLGGPLYAPDAPMLDGLLAAAAVREAIHGSVLDVPREHSPLVPVPLKTLWEDQRGFPLLACTAFLAEGDTYSDVIYHHKRHQPGTWTQRTKTGLPFAVKSTDGRYMDRQRPLTTQVTDCISCTALGHAEEIERLLRHISAIGKERQRGLGQVTRWEISEDPAFDLAPGGVLGRNIPYEAAGPLGLDLHGRGLTRGAWTHPHWQNGLYTLVYPLGTEVA